VHKEQLARTRKSASKEYATFEYGDIAATLLVYDRVKSVRGLKVTHTVGANSASTPKGNVISIGGPKWNKVTEKFIGAIGSPLYFRPGCVGVIERRKLHNHENCHAPSIETRSPGRQTICDYGVILCARSGYLDSGIPCALVLAGYSTYGVLIAAEYLVSCSPTDIRKLKKRLSGDRRFGFLIKGTAEVAPHGQVVSITHKELVADIPEREFLEPYEYQYDQEKAP